MPLLQSFMLLTAGSVLLRPAVVERQFPEALSLLRRADKLLARGRAGPDAGDAEHQVTCSVGGLSCISNRWKEVAGMDSWPEAVKGQVQAESALICQWLLAGKAAATALCRLRAQMLLDSLAGEVDERRERLAAIVEQKILHVRPFRSAPALLFFPLEPADQSVMHDRQENLHVQCLGHRCMRLRCCCTASKRAVQACLILHVASKGGLH
jgi:hypothetical protein